MQIIRNEKYKESYVEETLDNGLHVVLWNKPDYEKACFMMATPLGAMDLEQVDQTGKITAYPAGIAHFLEHKMFEEEEQDVMDLFSEMGANVNAFTSYNETAYYFSTSENPIKPLHLLLDFVQRLYISEASVEKEKGIIIQELAMYQQMSDQRLLMETFSSLFSKHPLKYDVGGDEASVNQITKEQLETCYHLNYHPSTMVLVGVSSMDPNILLKEIKANQAKKHFNAIHSVERVKVAEPVEVARSNFSFHMDVSIPKLSIAFKEKGIQDPYERLKKEWCYRILFDMAFTSINDEYQTWMDQGIINDYFNYEVDYGSDYGLIMIVNETNKKDEFIEVILKTLKDLKTKEIDQKVFEQLKRRYFGQNIRSLNSFDDILVTYMRNYFDQIDFFKGIDLVYDIKLEDIKEAFKSFDIDTYAIVELLPNQK
ncbi:MAG: pitrilysin family protein [Erysipelotrichaceae bacterium]